jgi:pyruvate-formate lyase-activating enzyme
MNKDYRCTLPFTGLTRLHLHLKEVVPCCKIKSWKYDDELLTEKHIALRQDIIDNVKSPLCKSCWDIEDEGGYSYRQRRSEHFATGWNITDATAPITKIEVKFSNKCQLMCMYCGPDNSTMWETAHTMKYPITAGYYTSHSIKIEDAVDVSKLTEVRVTGGEPMLEEQCIDFLLKLPYNKDRKLSIITNLSYGDTTINELLKITKLHPNIDVLCSLDAIGENITRRFLNWKLWERNYYSLLDDLQLRRKENPTATVQILVTVNILNYKNLQEIINYHINNIKNGYQGIHFVLNYVSLDEKLSIKSKEVDRGYKIVISEDDSALLSKIERNMIESMNSLLDTITVDKELEQQTENFLKEYNDYTPNKNT